MKIIKPANEVTRLLHAFGHSWNGFKTALTQPAFRMEIIMLFILVPTAWNMGVTTMQRALLIGSLLLILMMEIINTAIEITIDRISTDYHDLSKRAKDLGSLAVLMAIINATILWYVILL